jgi:hypothetical protein
VNILRVLAALGFAFIPAVLPAQDAPATRETLWTWFGNCNQDRKMELELLMNGKAIYRSSFPICPISDRSKETRKTIAFSIKGGHISQGEYHTTQSQTIEGNIWQAGADPGAILLGFSFSTANQILLNTVHVAKPDRVSTSEIDRGIVVRTFPLDRK